MNTCEYCGAKLITAEEIDRGICDDCWIDDFASAVLNTPNIYPNADDF